MENGNGNHSNSKPGLNNGTTDSVARRRKLIADWVYRLARTFSADADEETVEDYMIALGPIPEATLQVAFRKCLESWSKVGSMPPIAFVLDTVARYRSTIEQELTSAAKWGDGEAQRILAELRAKAPALPVVETTPEQERRLFTEQTIAAMRAKYPREDTVPRLSPNAPKDPEERKRWAHECAVKNGWLPADKHEREPGEEAE
jgi:hypothetical protein